MSYQPNDPYSSPIIQRLMVLANRDHSDSREPENRSYSPKTPSAPKHVNRKGPHNRRAPQPVMPIATPADLALSVPSPRKCRWCTAVLDESIDGKGKYCKGTNCSKLSQQRARQLRDKERRAREAREK